MIHLTMTWKELLTDLERERDLLRLKAHLGKAEARDLFRAVEERLHQLRVHMVTLKEQAKTRRHALERRIQDVADDARRLLAQIQEIV